MPTEALTLTESLPRKVTVGHASEREWNDLLPLFADASVYQTWAYGAVNWGEHKLSHVIVRQGEETLCIAQFRIIQLPVFSGGIAYLRWGPLYRSGDHAANAEHLASVLEVVREEYAVRRGLLVSILPGVFQGDKEGELIRTHLVQAGFRPNPALKPQRTIRVDLSPALDVLRKQLDPKWRNKLNGAGKNGLTIVEGTGDDLFGAFVQAYREMLARKRFEEGVSVDSFAQIQQRLPESLKMRVFLCQKEGRVLNALVVSAHGDTAIYLLGATTDEGTKAKGAYLLQWRAMEWLKEQGVRWYDLGGIDPEKNPGVYDFKSGFGGQEVTRLGEYRLSTSLLSTASVNAAERLRRGFKSLRARFVK